jgi:hypothetical protein
MSRSNLIFFKRILVALEKVSGINSINAKAENNKSLHIWMYSRTSIMRNKEGRPDFG